MSKGNWQKAFLHQAYSDFRMAEHLSREPERCHFLHYLQMSTEKLSKALSTSPVTGTPPKTHLGFVRFLNLVETNAAQVRPLLSALGMKKVEIRNKMKRVRPTAEVIESLAPALAKGTRNAEYPWETRTAVIAPAEHPFSEPEFSPVRLGELMKFLARCFKCLGLPQK